MPRVKYVVLVKEGKPEVVTPFVYIAPELLLLNIIKFTVDGAIAGTTTLYSPLLIKVFDTGEPFR